MLYIPVVNHVGTVISREIEFDVCLLSHLFPHVDFVFYSLRELYAMLEGSENAEDEIADVVNSGLTYNGKKYVPLGATNSTKSKRQILMVEEDYSNILLDYFGDVNGSIRYTSNFTTSLKELFDLTNINIIISSNDETTDDKSDIGSKYQLGDCHAKCNKVFADLVGYQNRAIQFRITVDNESTYDCKWIAKGTLLYSKQVDDDYPTTPTIVLPRSALKGNKPSVQQASSSMVFGTVFHSTRGTMALSYLMLAQFKPKTVINDLGALIERECHKILEAYQPHKFEEWLYQSLNRNKKDDDDELEVKTTLLTVLKADKYNQLSTHPWVVHKKQQALSDQWKDLALRCSPLKFERFMVMPDDTLSYGTVCIPELPQGDYLMSCHPMRWRYDWFKVTNKHRYPYFNTRGVIVMSHKTASRLGRDFDGDNVGVVSCERIPNMTKEVESWGDFTDITKPKKTKDTSSFGHMAYKVMDNCVGLITWCITVATVNGFNKDIEVLAQQLQIEVDSLKNLERADRELIDSYVDKYKYLAPKWLKQRNNKSVYVDTPLPSSRDTIGQIIARVNKHWKAPPQRCNKLRAFSEYAQYSSLIPSPAYITPELKQWLEQQFENYIKDMRNILKLELPEKLLVPELNKCIEEWRLLFDSLSADEREKALRVMWNLVHYSSNDKKVPARCSIIFNCFLDELCAHLNEWHIAHIKVMDSTYELVLLNQVEVFYHVGTEELNNPVIIDDDGYCYGEVPPDHPLNQGVYNLQEVQFVLPDSGRLYANLALVPA